MIIVSNDIYAFQTEDILKPDWKALLMCVFSMYVQAKRTVE
jgi:hypothetical protein